MCLCAHPPPIGRRSRPRHPSSTRYRVRGAAHPTAHPHTRNRPGKAWYLAQAHIVANDTPTVSRDLETHRRSTCRNDAHVNARGLTSGELALPEFADVQLLAAALIHHSSAVRLAGGRVEVTDIVVTRARGQ